MRCGIKKFFGCLLLFSCTLINGQIYQPVWQSIDSRPTPSWFSEAKFGIFIHWGVYSVPSFRPPENGKWDGIYAEWYEPDLMYKPWRNDSFHIKNYGKDFEYRDFAKLFKAELYDPAYWAEIIYRSGARYVVFTTKHSDGFCMWPTTDPVSKNWNCGEVGPKRDLFGDLVKELRKKSLRVGAYYSFLEYENMDSTTWPMNPELAHEKTGYYIPKEIFDKYTVGDSVYVNHLHYQLKELIIRYQPDIIWADAVWDRPASYWRSEEIVAWILNNAPNREEIVINDRWDNGEKKHGGYITTEYGTGAEAIDENRPWEECQGMGYSFGLNRLEGIEQYKTSRQLVRLLVSTVSRGGNLLLNIGPAADGTIHVIMQERLIQMGNWLKVNGEAIYGTRPFKQRNLLPGDFYYTYKNGTLYVIAISFPQNDIVLKNLKTKGKINVSMLGVDKKIKFIYNKENLKIIIPQLNPDMYQDAYVFKIEGVINE